MGLFDFLKKPGQLPQIEDEDTCKELIITHITKPLSDCPHDWRPVPPEEWTDKLFGYPKQVRITPFFHYEWQKPMRCGRCGGEILETRRR